MTEFEVTSPRRMLIRVEDLSRKQFGFPIRSQLRLESAIEIMGVVGAPEPESKLRECASALAEKLHSSLPKEPWKGLGPVSERSEKGNWDRLGEI